MKYLVSLLKGPSIQNRSALPYSKGLVFFIHRHFYFDLELLEGVHSSKPRLLKEKIHQVLDKLSLGDPKPFFEHKMFNSCNFGDQFVGKEVALGTYKLSCHELGL